MVEETRELVVSSTRRQPPSCPPVEICARRALEQDGNPYPSSGGTVHGRIQIAARECLATRDRQASRQRHAWTLERGGLYVSLVSSRSPSAAARARRLAFSRSIHPRAPDASSPVLPRAYRASQRAGAAFALCAPGRRYIKAF